MKNKWKHKPGDRIKIDKKIHKSLSDRMQNSNRLRAESYKLLNHCYTEESKCWEEIYKIFPTLNKKHFIFHHDSNEIEIREFIN